jgi:hypothetical protein
LSHIPTNPSKSFVARNPHLYGGQNAKVVTRQIQEGIKRTVNRLRQSDKPPLNKLETEFYNHLLFSIRESFGIVRQQAKRYKLANGTWYKPDFTSMVDGRETAWEVKGPYSYRAGMDKLKIAAHQWPEVRFVLVWKQDGVWQEQEIRA